MGSPPTRWGLIGGQVCGGEFNSGEGMLAGGGCISDGRTPAKPPWSEVMIFLDVFLQQEGICPAKQALDGDHKLGILE